MKMELLNTLLTGHPVIDQEHKKIVNSINEVTASIQNHEFQKCADLMDRFLTVCADHFTTEEKLLAELDYPHLKSHITFHRELTLKAKAVRILCMDMNDQDGLQRCFDEMAALLIEDVIKGDMAFVSFLIEKGVTKPREYAFPIPKHLF